MRFCLIFGAVLRELILSCGIAVLQNQVICGIYKISGNFNGVCGILMLLCALFIRISVRFCDIRTPPPPLPPYTIYSFQKCCGIKDVFQCNSNNLYKHAVLRLFRLSQTFFFFFFCKTRTDY